MVGAPPLTGFSEHQLLASLCRDSFADFVKEFWDVVVPEKLVWNWHMDFLCRELQKVAERVFKGLPKLYDLIINISPGSTKSTIATIMFPVWCWVRMPSSRVISASYAHTLATDLSRKSRDVVKSDKFRQSFPGIDIRDDQDAKAHFINTKGGERYAFGVGGAVLGKHGHFIIVDDPINPTQAVSEAELKAANRWMEETLPSRKVDKMVTPMILIMQRLHENDPTGSRLEKADRIPVRHICIPAELTENLKPAFLKKYYVNGLMDPNRLPHEALAEAEAQGQYVFAAQYLQTPIPRGGAMFHTNELRRGTPPDRFQRVVRFWDKAGTSGGGNFSVGVKIGLDKDGRYWILDVRRGQWDAYRREKMIEDTASEDGRSVTIGVEQEPGSGGKESAEATVRRLAGFHVVAYRVGRSDGDKEARADPFASQVNAGNVYLAQGEWNQLYVDELRFFPRSKFKDQVDASSGGFNMLARPRIVVGGASVLGRRRRSETKKPLTPG